MGSSNHVFFSPREPLNIHLAQTSMWLHVVRSPRSDGECPGGARQGTFIRTQRDVVSVFLLGVNVGFTQPLEMLS